MNLKAFWTSLPRAARVYLTAVGAVSAAAFAVVVTGAATGTPLLAASPSPSPSPGTGTNYCSRFTGHLASNLGKSQSQVQKAISDALSQTIDDAVKNGDLTQSQASAIKARVGSNATGQCAGGLKGIPGIVRGGGPGPRFGGARFNQLDEVAKALGITTAQLQQDLQSGKTVQQLASAQGMDEAAFRTKLAGVTKTDLDQQVKAGNLTQNQENAILQQIQTGPLPLWNGAPKRFGPPRGAAPSPSPSGTP
ncbi:MAG TPA: hypothetical protein VE953_06905 [Terriglobales bacterium]|nr:hypothetical protein [Terriglobales bacterium]